MRMWYDNPSWHESGGAGRITMPNELAYYTGVNGSIYYIRGSK